jgi:hypothetical protein
VAWRISWRQRRQAARKPLAHREEKAASSRIYNISAIAAAKTAQKIM